jgi:hypothetical protein
MKTLFGIIAAVTFVGVGSALAAKDEAKAPAPAIEKKIIPIAVDQTVSDAVRNQALETAKLALESKEWAVYLSHADNPRARATADVLTFKEGKVFSKNLVSQGYAESNYTLSIGSDGIPVWETMQVNEKEGLAFMRGELRTDEMKGAISMQPHKGGKSTLYFSTLVPAVQPAAQAPAPSKRKGKR